VSLKTLSHRSPVGDCGGGLVDNDNVETGQLLWVLSKRLSNNSLDAISCCSFATVLFRDGQTQPCDLIIALSAEHCK